MTEEVKPVEGGEVKPQEQSNEPQYTEIEQKALEMGWRPKEDFEGSEDDFIDAKEFVRRQPLFDKIEHTTRELKAVRKALDALKAHQGTIEEGAYKRAMQDFKKEQKAALEEGDIVKYHQITEQIDQAKEEAANIRAQRESIQVQDNVVHPQFQSWVNRNPWYNSAPHMRIYADQVGQQFIAQGNTPDQVLKLVEEAVRKEFPNKFSNPNKKDAPVVENSSRRTANTKGGSGEDYPLTEQERTIMNTLVRGGHITKEKYIADLKKAKER